MAISADDAPPRGLLSLDLTQAVALRPNNFTALSRTPWAGKALAKGIKKRHATDSDQPIGESWELSCDPEAPSKLLQVSDATLADLIACRTSECLSGNLVAAGRTTCDILVKLINPALPLSLQIHPSDDNKLLKSNECGKPESWLVLSCDKGSGLYIGFSRHLDKRDIQRLLETNQFSADLLQFVPVKPGDFFEIEPHVPHAIGPGVVLLEPQRVIAEKIGFDPVVSVSRSEQRFSLLDTVEGDGKTKFTFLSVGTPTYTFYCSDASEDRCNIALDEYLLQLQEVRQKSIVSGLDRLQTLLESLPINTAANEEKISALKAAKPLIKGELALLSTTTNAVGATVSTVKISTYAFGLLAGALVGLLIALQLTLIDKRVRSLSQLSKQFESHALIGTVTAEPASIQHVAAAVVARAHALSISSVALVPVDEQTEAVKLAEKLDAVTASMGVTITALAPISSLTASDLISSHSGLITLASRGVSVTEEIVATWSVLDNAQKPILGVLLSEPAL